MSVRGPRQRTVIAHWPSPIFRAAYQPGVDRIKVDVLDLRARGANVPFLACRRPNLPIQNGACITTKRFVTYSPATLTIGKDADRKSGGLRHPGFVYSHAAAVISLPVRR